MASEAQNSANRENAQKSHGPTSADGFERCKASSVTHGLTAKLGRLITDSEEAYEKSIKNTFLRLQPVTESEKAMVQFIGENEWKLARAALYEQAVMAKGIWDNRNSFNNEEECPAEIRDVIVLGQVLQTNAKVLQSMNTEFARTRRTVEKSIAEYEKVRRDRELIEEAARNVAMDSTLGKSTDPCLAHPTVGTLYPLPFLIARLEFCNGVGRKKVYAFDRVWTDPHVKPAAIPWVWTKLRSEPAA
jgi:hypothetical protein